MQSLYSLKHSLVALILAVFSLGSSAKNWTEGSDFLEAIAQYQFGLEFSPHVYEAFLFSSNLNKSKFKPLDLNNFRSFSFLLVLNKVSYDTLFRTNKKEKLLKLLRSNGLNLDLLRFEENKKASYTCGENSNPNWYCAIASRKSDPSVQFFAEDPNEKTARIKATRECFKEYSDCTIVFSGK